MCRVPGHTRSGKGLGRNDPSACTERTSDGPNRSTCHILGKLSLLILKEFAETRQSRFQVAVTTFHGQKITVNPMASVRMKVPSIRRFIRNHGEPLTPDDRPPRYLDASCLICSKLYPWVTG